MGAPNDRGDLPTLKLDRQRGTVATSQALEPHHLGSDPSFPTS